MNFPSRLGWLTSRRLVQVVIPVVAVVLLLLVLYNATAVDRVPPSIVSIKPSRTSTDGSQALTLTSIDVQFSEDVQETTAEHAFKIDPNVPGSFHWKGRQTLIFTPSEKLPLAATFQVTMGPGVKDVAGNTETGASVVHFATVGEPKVASVAPASNASQVPVDSKIQVTFDRFMDPDSVVRALQVSPSIIYETTWNGPSLLITPTSNLQYGVTYTISIGTQAVDTDGTHLTGYKSTFQTVGIGLLSTALIPAPNVAGVSVRSPIAVAFDGQIDPASIASQSPFQITPPVAGDVRVVSLADDQTPIAQRSPPAQGASGNVIVFTPSAPLASHTTYAVTLKPVVRRTDGAAAAEQSWRFTTGEPATSAQNQIAFLSDRSGVANVWLMNPDGTNTRQLTAELVPVVGFDVSPDGSRLVYTSGGIVKRVSVGGTDLQTVTAPNRFEYAPSFSPDGNAIIVGRRDQTGADQGYWRISIAGAGGEQQILPGGAPGLGSVAVAGGGLTEAPGRPSWAPRTGYSADGKLALIVCGDGTVQLIDLTGAAAPVKLPLTGAGQPIWLQNDDAFYATASDDGGETWNLWRVGRDGKTAKLAPAVGELAGSGDGHLALLVQSGPATHLAYDSPAGTPTKLTDDPTWSDRSPSFAPDGKTIVFGRVLAASPADSGGIWVIRPDGGGLSQLATDGIYPRWMP